MHRPAVVWFLMLLKCASTSQAAEGDPSILKAGKQVAAVAWSPDGKALAGGGSGWGLIWDPATGKEIAQLKPHKADMPDITSLAGNPDGAILATGTQGAGIGLWDPPSGKAIALGKNLHVDGLAWRPDGRSIAAVGERKLVLWYVPYVNQLEEVEIRDPKFHGLNASFQATVWKPDGKYLAAGGEREGEGFILIRTVAGKEIWALKHKGATRALAWSPDGKTLASGDAGGTIRLWNPDTGKEVSALNGHEDDVQSLAWSPDGKILASGGEDGTVRLWNPATQKQLTLFKGHERGVSGVSWRPDGKRVASGSLDETIRIWVVSEK